MTYGGGGTNIFYTKEGDKHFCHTGADKHFYTGRGGQTFHVEDVGGDDDVDGEEEDVSGAIILASEARKLSAGARIFRGP